MDLSKANLTGVIANYANFYSGVSGTATANYATMTGSKWNNAYLANADFGNAVLQSTEWTQAVLVGANFESADLSKNTTAGEITDFTGAYLQGAVFLNATVTDADFTSTYWDAVTANDFYIQLQRGNLEFTGYWNDPDTPECVYVSYPNSNNEAAGTPLTSASNTCPDGNLGPCDAVWGNPKTPIDQATPASSYSALPGSCTTSDSMWIY